MGSHDRHAATPALRPAATDRPTRAGDAAFGESARRMRRRYEIAGISPDGTPQNYARVLAAEPHLDAAFAAFLHGTLIATPQGPVAVEDLAPGMILDTVDAGPKPLLWAGSTVLSPAQDEGHAGSATFTRVTADSLGLGRPMPDLVLGPHARILYRHPGCQGILGSNAVFAPASAFVDGVALIALRAPQAMRVYHLALRGQHILTANGVEVESYHPGDGGKVTMDPASRIRFLSLFPHLDAVEGFGPMPFPRLTELELDALRAA